MGIILKTIRKGIKRFPPTAILFKVLASIYHDGFSLTYARISNRMTLPFISQKYKKSYKLSWTERRHQQNTEFTSEICFSILVPLYNTPAQFLRSMIESVQKQTYTSWELCLADGSTENQDEVALICKQYAMNDRRIKYQRLGKNEGISGNTNQCIRMASGNYLALLDHDDMLHPSALFHVAEVIVAKHADLIYTDEGTFTIHPRDMYLPHFKPDYAPDTLRGNNYICHFCVFSKALADQVGGFRSEFDGSQDYDMILRLTENAHTIVHIPRLLYFWRGHAASVASDITAKPYVTAAARHALSEHLSRVGLKGEVCDTVVPSIYRIKYEISGEPLISILIPNCNHPNDLRKCIMSILKSSTYPHYEIIIIENNSTDEEVFQLYTELSNNPKINVIRWQKSFNYSAINNFGERYAKGEYILMLNNDVEVITPDWMQEMLMFTQRSDVGIAGAKLYYPNNKVQHAGIGLGLLSLAGHYHRGFDRDHPGYMGRLIYAQNVTAVTGACLMIKKSLYEEIGGFEEEMAVAFNDVDFCMKVRKRGYLVVFTPFAELYHYESLSRGIDTAPEKRKRFIDEVEYFQKKWAKELAAGDPYFNPNFNLNHEDFLYR